MLHFVKSKAIRAMIGSVLFVVVTLLLTILAVPDNSAHSGFGFYGSRALIVAGAEGHFFTVRVLSTLGVGINSRTDKGRTALLGASEGGWLDIVQYLLARGADVNSADRDGYTALMAAAFNGHAPVVRLLLDYGALTHLENRHGESAFTGACYRGRVDVVKLFLHNKLNPDDTNISTGSTGLEEAAQAFQSRIVSLLLDAGANPNAKNNSGITALMWAAFNGDLDSAGLLLDRGADVNDRDNDDRTALMWACAYGRTEMARLLLARGADVEQLCFGEMSGCRGLEVLSPVGGRCDGPVEAGALK